MLDNSHGTNRRTVLQTIGGAVGVAGISGAASAADGTVEVNVGYDAESGRQAALNAAMDVEREFNFDALTITVAEEAIAGLAARDDVRYVEENGTYEALGETTPWGIDRTDADVAHANGETGKGADVAIVDTGIDDDHPDLQGNIADPSVSGNHKAYERCKGPNCNYDWSDDNDHGTHCSGTADGVDNTEGVIGVSTQANLHALKALDKRGSGTYSNIAAAVEYTADQGWDVASMSLGGSSSSQTLKDACQYAYDNGVLLVAAAGNDGPCSDCVGYPAKYSTVMAVSATSCDDTLASFSSTGPEIEIAAPGENVYSTIIGGYDTYDGTSMACPHVSGAGAQLMANGYTNTEARQQLKDSAEDLGLPSNDQGAGLLDVAAALGLDSSDDGTGDGPNC
ncbi:S8 family peptidase [Haloparvum sp. PAK95]|uniref:S8 family peptidase n=1 Tax=Haloparvum sp. PAK95 TaxID=3418962 RepID=UPI003D2F3BEC